jgi:hypothetical protein
MSSASLPSTKRREVRLLPMNSGECHHFLIQEFVTPLVETQFDEWYNQYISQWGGIASFVLSALNNSEQFKVPPNHNWSTTTLTKITAVRLNDQQRSKLQAGQGDTSAYTELQAILINAPNLSLQHISRQILGTLSTQSKRDHIMIRMIKEARERGWSREYVGMMLKDPKTIETLQQIGAERGLPSNQINFVEALRRANENL